jgi:hypothetical protein
MEDQPARTAIDRRLRRRAAGEHVLNALEGDRIAKSGRFRLDEWPDMPFGLAS